MIKTLRSLFSYAALTTIALVAVVTTQLVTTQKTPAIANITPTVIHSFNSSNKSDGSTSEAESVQNSDRNLYGTRYGGGANDKDLIFRVPPNDSNFNLFYLFRDKDGQRTNSKIAATSLYVYVSPTGSDTGGDGSLGKPLRTLAYAAKRVQPNQNYTIYLNAGVYRETEATVLPPGVNIEGAGESSVTITSNGAIPAPGINTGSTDWSLWHYGSIIQLVSPSYSGSSPRYGAPSEMVEATDGNQTLSGFTIDGNGKIIKAGVWVENRNNVTMHNVTFKDFQHSGAVFTRGNMWWFVPLPEGKWMKNTTIHDCTFINSAADGVSGGSTGNLRLGGLDGADIYNITIRENKGYGIKFIHVGHLRNVKIHDCDIQVPEVDSQWSEDASIELWNLSYGNEIYNVTCNTWLSMVNHAVMNDYQPTATHPSNLKMRNVRIKDIDGQSVKESIEVALSGVEISDSYFQDKGFGIAIWGGKAWGGSIENHNINIHNNIFANVARKVQFGFGNSTAVFIPDLATNIKIHNNVFDTLGNSLQLNSADKISIKNNVFLNSQGDDVQGGNNIAFTNNLRRNTNPAKPTWQIRFAANATNIQGDPRFTGTGDRWNSYYKAASSRSLMVDRGTNVGLPYSGSAPDIGRWEW
ncbi:right-handed parallel beta-helix repeat-containing protein [Nostoc sp. ATCC 53789]|uniref:right-handed parallel beta-helix repeat-containing protein n=1 Tax=Nostoc sp. ATCC 53789 TaxID=76335 RepID=UPI000DEC8219|nr:right-handed parallel beta-helix repeat-containing protein [Nostoc sp. ATCC 53789]QHG14830.1 hypothetical protein GJB62_01735 [Nostoc sp. ATCC 53789]RCJ26834.1 hypothetical protein A6V25_19195 [Nostoc sp. ATCC 53789]